MARKSFMENLRNLPGDMAKEVKGMLNGKSKETTPASGVDRQAEITKKFAPKYAEDRRRSEARAAEIRRQIDDSLRGRADMDAFLNQPSSSERGARLVATRDTRPEPVSLERARLLQQREVFLQIQERTRDAKQKKDAETRLAQIDRQLRAA